jgi:hypothetical protein
VHVLIEQDIVTSTSRSSHVDVLHVVVALGVEGESSTVESRHTASRMAFALWRAMPMKTPTPARSHRGANTMCCMHVGNDRAKRSPTATTLPALPFGCHAPPSLDTFTYLSARDA